MSETKALRPTYIVVSPAAAAHAAWWFDEVFRWEGRDWRRLKRERRKFLKRYARRQAPPSTRSR